MGDNSSGKKQELSKYPKTCLICFETDKIRTKFFDLWLADSEQITLLEKLQSFSQEKLWVNECTLLCESCLKDLNNAFQFKRRIFTSQEFWRNASVSLRVPNLCNEIGHVSDNSNKNTNYQVSDEDVNDFTTPIGHFDHEIKTENLKAEELAEDSLTYYTCKNCDALFANSNEFAAHKCDIVQNVLKSTVSYSDEEIECNSLSQGTSTPRKKFKNSSCKCDLCGKKFKDINGKNSHKVKVHFQEKVFPCNFCNKSFKQKYHLKEHLTSHTGEKNYPCSICNKIFQRISSQRRHMRIHERVPGEKMKQTPFLCTICGKTFPYSNGVQRHLRIHSGDKKYECNICSRKFTQSTHLRVHLRTHTGEKPYMCNFCGDSFTLNVALQKHILSSHDAEHN